MTYRRKRLRLWTLLMILIATWGKYGSASREPDGATEESTIPDFFNYFKRDFTLMLEMTEINNNLTKYVRHSYFAGSDEGEAVEASVVTTLEVGAFIAYHYFPGINRYIEQFDDSCIEPEDHHPDYQPYGWFDDNEDHGVKMYGPATILRSTHFQEATFQGTEFTIDGIKCEKWQITDGTVEINLYFSAQDLFNMPEKGLFDDPQIANRLPVMFEVLPEMRSQHVRYTVVNFIPELTPHSSIETPRGLDCEDKISIEPTKKVPSIPSHFTMSNEVVLNSFIDGLLSDEEQQLIKYQLTYSKDLALVRLDTSLPKEKLDDKMAPDKIIHDFNTGVQYAINRQFGHCERDFIPAYSFDKTHPGYIGGFGVMAGPNELFHIDEKYAYVGPRGARSQMSDLYTSTRSDIPDPDFDFLANLPKAVLEYYFVESEVSTPDFIGIPSRGDLFIYNKTDPLLLAEMTTTNIFGTKTNSMTSTSEFSVIECFDKWSDDWSNIYIFFPANKEQFAAEAASDNEFKNHVYGTLLALGDISPTRIGSIDVSDGTSGWYSNTSDSDVIIAMVKLLERAPYLYGYRLPDDPLEIPGDEERAFDVRHLDDCAELCTLEELFDCKSFHYCEEQGSCHLSKKTGADGPQTLNYTCMHYIDNHENQTFDDLPSSEVDTRLRSYISDKKFHFSIKYLDKEVNFTATQHIMFQNPDPTDPIRKQFYLYERHKTIRDPDAILEPTDNSLLGCMNLCLSWKEFRCETLVHNEYEHECFLYTQHAKEINETRFETKLHSYVHTRNYVDDYSYMLGGISINTTGPIVRGFSPEECAMECSTKKDYNCNSFEFCWEDATCHLHVETFMDVSDGGNYSTTQQCAHFEKKAERIFTRYPKQGMPNENHKLVAQLTSVTECANLCLEKTGSDASQTCQSYDFCVVCEEGDYGVCGSDHKGGINMCFLGNHHLGEPDLQLVAADNCEHYSRDLFGDQDYASWIASNRLKEKPYTPGSMAGLAFGMIFLGIIVALGLLFALVKFHPETVPKSLVLNIGSGKLPPGPGESGL